MNMVMNIRRVCAPVLYAVAVLGLLLSVGWGGNLALAAGLAALAFSALCFGVFAHTNSKASLINLPPYEADSYEDARVSLVSSSVWLLVVAAFAAALGVALIVLSEVDALRDPQALFEFIARHRIRVY